MSVKDHVVLSSDGGSVTMGRRLAFYSYGKFDVVIPEGREQQVDDDRIQNGYIARNPGQRMGRFDFGFIRQDATINLEAQTSDLELAIDSTEKRSEGDVYVERDISRAGMNGFELGRDFGLDDIVRYRVWGNYLRLPVTAGDLESSVAGGLRGVRVHVGGQVASDGEARRRANNEILGQIENEKRQRLRQVNAESRARTAAISAESRRSDAYADAAVSGVESRLSRDFEASYERYSKALSQLGDTWRQELKNGLSAEQQARVEALRQEQLARERAGTDLRGQLEKTLDDAVAGERKARESAISGERTARNEAISAEAKNRSDAISAEQRERDAAIRAEAQARALADSEEARARQKAISDLSQSFTTDLLAYGELVKEAKNYVDPATAQVVAFWSKENQNNFNKAVQLTLAAQSAYNDINNIKWVSNDAWQAQQEKINEARSKFEAQQIEIDAAQDEVAKANRKASDAAKQAADAAKQAADTASDLATKNGILLAKIKQLQGELDKRAAGSITAFADENRWSAIHKKAIEMPKSSRWLVVYAEPSFKGTITVLVNYSNGNTQTYWARGADMDTVSTGSVSSVFAQTCGKDGVLKKKGFVIALGSVGSATMIFDNVEWS